MDESPQPTRRSERVANRGPKPRSPSPSVSLITLSSSPPPPPPPRRRQKATKRPAVKRPDAAAPQTPRYGDCITLSPSPCMSSTPQPRVPEELSTPASAQQKVRFLGRSNLYRSQAKRGVEDDAEMPLAKRARPDLRKPTTTPLALQNEPITLLDGDVILSSIEPSKSKRSRMPNRRGNATPREDESPTLLRGATDTSQLPPPVSEVQSPASPTPNRAPEEKEVVDQATKESQIKQWLKGMKAAYTQLTPPTSISSVSVGPTSPAPPTTQPSPTRRVPVQTPKKVEVVSISSDSSSEPPSDLTSEHHSVHSYVSASKSTSKKQGSEYESAHELLSTHEGAHVEDDNVGEMANANGSESGSLELNKEEEATPTRHPALDIRSSIF
uniref:Uncharacterized protein n=1 Tax=Bionectria ochroleuca TaxID=29856 RepID=A0A8H7N3Y0_BIOOC